MPLSDTGVRNAKPTEKARKIADEKGLYLLVLPSGSKLWRMDYRYQGKRKTLSFGGYPDTGLALARQKRDDARRLLAQDIDPSAEAKAKKDAQEKSANNTLEVVANDWMKTKGTGWTVSYALLETGECGLQEGAGTQRRRSRGVSPERTVGDTNSD